MIPLDVLTYGSYCMHSLAPTRQERLVHLQHLCGFVALHSPNVPQEWEVNLPCSMSVAAII